MDNSIVLHNVSKFYKNGDIVSTGIYNVDLKLNLGEFITITGESGSGKSTLLNIISGLDNIDEGEVIAFSETFNNFSCEDYENYRKENIAIIFQDYNLVNSYTVYQNIELALLLRGKTSQECKIKVNELIELVGLKKHSNRKVSKLSGGQKQRVAIARAVALDTPVIVADEPTGNLDEDAARKVVEVLKKVSAKKMVVIVTHNFEQFEKYATRKITLCDGKIIEDRTLIETNIEICANSDGNEDVKFNTILRLGYRNMFNVPIKLILLLVLYTFITLAILYQYVAVKNYIHQNELLGENPIFINTESSRLILTKKNKEKFNDDDFTIIHSNNNIESIIRNDVLLDSTVLIDTNYFCTEGTIYPADEIDDEDLAFGTIPKDTYDVVLSVDNSSDGYDVIAENGEQLIGKTFYLHNNDYELPIINGKIKIAGIIISDKLTDASQAGYSRFYVGNKLADIIFRASLATSSITTISYNGYEMSSECSRLVFTSNNVPAGDAYIFEDQSFFYPDDKAIGLDVSISVSDPFYSEKKTLKINQVVTSTNCDKLLGIDKDDYDLYCSYIFINPKDFKKLYKSDTYQISAFVKEENISGKTAEILSSNGYRVFEVKTSLSNESDEFDYLIKLLAIVLLFVEYVVMIYIMYGVISLIMKYRRKYYSILRMIGAYKNNIEGIIAVELFSIMVITFSSVTGIAYLIMNGVIKAQYIKMQLNYINTIDFVIVLFVIAFMTMFISKRYAKKMFIKSAIDTHKTEV